MMNGRPMGHPGGMGGAPQYPNHGFRPNGYATVNNGIGNESWRAQGGGPPMRPDGSGPAGTQPGAPQPGVPAGVNPNAPTFTQPAAPSAGSERDDLVRLLQRRARQKPSRHRALFRRKIEEAQASPNAVIALRQLAHGEGKGAAGTAAPAQRPAKAGKSAPGGPAVPVQASEILNLQRIRDTLPLPTQEQYPEAPKQLFDAMSVSNAVNMACQNYQIPMQTETDFSKRRMASHGRKQHPHDIQTCTLRLEIADICQETAVGEGGSKQDAKRAAWLKMISQMHLGGSLKELFPDPNSMPDTIMSNGQPLHPTKLDNETMKNEKDAKTEIYNYAASMGMVPEFEVNAAQPRLRGRRPRNQKQKPVMQVTVRLAEAGITASAAGKDLRTAEIAAALEFKRQAEVQRPRGDDTPVSDVNWSILKLDTAVSFFDFCKQVGKGMNLEVENETVEQGGISQNLARVLVDGSPIGQPVTMSTKKQAEPLAYLVAAVETAKKDPQLLSHFEQTLAKGNGKLLRPLGSVDLPVEFGALQAMKDGLLEAREAGLPDSKQALPAETYDAAESVRRRRRRLSPEEAKAVSEDLVARHQEFETDPALEELRTKKAFLPMHQYRGEVLSMITDNLFTVIIGATGSGKTTQVPQILFDNAIKKSQGAACNIICTQPRRIAATSVGQRVAAERNEPLQKTVGYQVRFDSKLQSGPYGIAYCTTGILLERLKNDADDVLETASHVIIDEVHERDLNIDFLMIVLKRAMKIRQSQGKSVPKVVLMSATLDTELFAKYFGQKDSDGNLKPCPALSVPGRTFPVKNKFLGSVIQDLFEAHGSGVQRLLQEDPATTEYLKAETGFSSTKSQESSRAVSQAASRAASPDSAIDWKRERATEANPEQGDAAREKEESLVPSTLAAATIAHICSISREGAVLAFFPGLEEILSVQKVLLERQPLGLNFNDSSKFKLCLLHSSMPKETQNEIFEPSPAGCRKIILSTNIAETSVTVPDVKYVVDTGKLREKRYDQIRRITKLSCVWESKSNSRQRAGRAGRVQEGFYYALFSQERNDALRAIGLPELLRSDLQETCLAIKAQRFNEPIASFLAQAIEPPPKPAVDAAIKSLKDIEAYTAGEELTALGRLLSQLPVHPTLGKMIILGVIFRCLDPMIILGAAAEERSMFVSPLGAKVEANRAHRSYAGRHQSDQIAFLEAFKELRQLKSQNGMHAAWDRARENFLHMGAFRTIDQTARQMEDILRDSGIVPGRNMQDRHRPEFGPSELNRNADNYDLVKCLYLAGVHPNLASKFTSSGITFRTPSEQNVIMHPSSINAEGKQKTSPKIPYGTLFAYSTLAKSNDGNSLFVRDTSQITPLMAALFGGSLRMTETGRLEMDEWLPFFVKHYEWQYATKLILEFRKALDRVLNSAFISLSENKSGAANWRARGQFADDPMREMFARRVVEVLDQAAGKSVRQMQSAFMGRPPMGDSGYMPRQGESMGNQGYMGRQMEPMGRQMEPWVRTSWR